MSGPDTDPLLAQAQALIALRPPGGRLHLLDLDTAADPPFNETWLSEDERERAARFVTPRLRARYRSAHLFTRARLAACTGQKPERLQYTINDWGKPELCPAPGQPTAPHFSLSHSQHLALLAISPQGPVGADIEILRDFDADEMRSMARTIMTPSEQVAFAGLLARPDQSPAPATAFLTAWTRKEACVKALGLGLSYPVDQVDTGLQPVAMQVPMQAVAPGHVGATLALQTRVLGKQAVVSVARLIC